MSKTWLVGVSAVLLVTAQPVLSRATNISTKKLNIKDGGSVTKRSIAVQSTDPAVLLSGADNPGANGASVHVYSATQDFCAILPSGANWKQTKSGWKFADKLTKNGASVGNGKLGVKIKSNVTFTLAGSPQGAVNVQVQFGTGTRYCLRCSGAKKDTTKIFLAKACAAAACDPEPSSCTSVGATTTTSTTVTTTTSTTFVPGVVVGSLPTTAGRFNYNLMLGLSGAESACNTSFPGSHACRLSELQATPASALMGLKDTTNMTVTSFWAIDPAADPVTAQCCDDATFNPCTSVHNWEYGTAHTLSRGQKVPLDNATGVIGSLVTMVQCNFAPNNWVGCCK